MGHSEAKVMSFEPPADDLEYNEKLFKEILPTFKNHMPPLELRDCPIISAKLSGEEMERVHRVYDREGRCAAARYLLEVLNRKANWFPALLEALDSDDLKLKDFKPKFEKLKKKVDQEWRQAQSLASTVAVNNPSGLSEPRPPTQVCMETDRTTVTTGVPVPVPVSGQSGITNDFKLPLPPTAGLQTDTALESMEEEPSEPMPSASGAQVQEQEVMDEGMSPQAEPEEQYTDASSTPVDETYQRLQPKQEDENEYTELTNLCLEKDATPVPVQPSEVLEQEVGQEPQPQVLTPQQVSHRRRPRPQTREEHPSLRQAISRDPLRDFEETLVKDQLAALPGWSRHQEEHKVIQLIRPNRNTDGYYVIWFWKLAKRPTICVAQGGRVITFVVHKSARPAARQTKYYINKRQKVSESLRELVEFHCAQGIQYCPQQGRDISILWLNHAYVRQ